MKSKKVVITLAIVFVVLVVLAVGAVAALYFTTDVFKTSDQLFWKYFSKNSEIFDVLQNENETLQKSVKQLNSYTSTGDFTISTQIGETNPQEIKIATTGRHDVSTGRTYADATLKKGDNNLLSVSYINSDDVYAVKCDDVYQYYIGFRNSNLKEFARNMGIEEENVAIIPDSFDFESLGFIFKLSDAEKQHISETYSKVIFESIPKENYQKVEKEAITVTGTNYDANKYELVISSETLRQVVINCLTTLKEDTTTLGYITGRLSIINPEETLSNSDIISKIDEMIEKMSSGTSDESEGESLIISTYEQNGTTIRTELEVTSVGKITIDLVEGQFTLSVEEYSTLDSEANNSNMQITLSKTTGQGITNSMVIVPDLSNPEQYVTIYKTIGNAEGKVLSNTYSMIWNTEKENTGVTQTITYNTQDNIVSEVEEIMELQNSNSVIVNNYPLDQLAVFFSGITEKVEQVLGNVSEQLQTEITTLLYPLY